MMHAALQLGLMLFETAIITTGGAKARSNSIGLSYSSDVGRLVELAGL